MIPERLLRAIERYNEEHPPVLAVSPTMTPGEIVIVESPDGGLRSVAVLGRPQHHVDGREWRGVLIADNFIEAATDLDLIVRREGSYDLVVYAELYCQVWADQVVGHVDQLDPERFDAIQYSLATDGESLAPHLENQLPLAGPADWRWKHRHDMLNDVIVPIRQDCVSTLLDWFWGDD